MPIFFAVLACLMTFAGGLIPIKGFSRPGLLRLFGLRAGILLAVAFTEILPEALERHHLAAGWGALGGFAVFLAMQNFAMADACPEYLEECRTHTLGLAALAALTIHSFIDGFNLAVSYAAGPAAGMAVGVALALHKTADGFTLTSLLREAGYPSARRLTALSLLALATVAGAAWKAGGVLGPESAKAGAGWLGFAGGSFIYLAAADMLPRLHKSEDKQSLAYFGLGLLGMSSLKLLG